MTRRSPIGRVPSPVGGRSTPTSAVPQRTATPQNRPPSVTRRPPEMSKISVPVTQHTPTPSGPDSRPQSVERRQAAGTSSARVNSSSVAANSSSARGVGNNSARQPLSGRPSIELNNPRPGSGRIAQNSPGRLASSRSVTGSITSTSTTVVIERKSGLIAEPPNDVVLRHLGVHMSKALEVLETTTSIGLPIRTNTSLIPGDMILECNGFALTSLEHLKQVLTAYDGREPIQLTLLRGSSMINLAIDNRVPQESA